MRNKKYLIIVLILFSQTIFAYQSKVAKDNQTLDFNISKTEYSRILVAGDRISSVKGKSGLYEIKEFKGESEDGVVFIRPTQYATSSISIFISTEHGHHYLITLHIKSSNAENIEIKPITPIKAQASKWEQNSSYTETLVALLRGMVNGNPPEGYAIIDVNAIPVFIASGICTQLLQIYRGSALSGEIWLISNPNNKTIHIVPTHFYQKNVVALSIVNDNLKPKENTYLFRIMTNE